MVSDAAIWMTFAKADRYQRVCHVRDKTQNRMSLNSSPRMSSSASTDLSCPCQLLGAGDDLTAPLLRRMPNAPNFSIGWRSLHSALRALWLAEMFGCTRRRFRPILC